MNIIESLDGKERFVTAVDTTGHKKDMPYLAALLKQSETLWLLPPSFPSPSVSWQSSCPVNPCPDVMGGRHARMGPERARKTVFIRANLRFQSKEYTKRPFIAWNPDSVESDGYMGASDPNESESEEGSDSDVDFWG